MAKSIEDIERKITEDLKFDFFNDLLRIDGIDYIEYSYSDGDYCVSARRRAEDYIAELIENVNLPDGWGECTECERDESECESCPYNYGGSYDDCDEDWQIKLCVHCGKLHYNDIEWWKVAAEVEENGGIIESIVYDLAYRIAEQQTEESEND